ncbi:TonB family protein [Uliginosibacterium sp. H3]|uniref:TonB family protein n=1 Tax=Uliginosibacterium silvisoli TaxID=3114758 RepID=A0ABU6K0P0_9RHOO|nr:TonB family protein [Uliginosibacterium sp. H3]
MIAADINPAFHGREDPGKWGSLALTLFIHGVLALVLFYGVQWQHRSPEPVQVELVRALPPPVYEPPVPVLKPEPPKPAPVPKEVEPPPEKKPDIALPKAPDKPVEKKPKPEERKAVELPKPPEKVPPKPQEKPAEPVKPQVEPRKTEAQRMNEMLALESQKASNQAKAQADARKKQEQDAVSGRANDKARDEWAAAIAQKVRGQLSVAIIPPGNPEAEFDIELWPSGEVRKVRLSKSSGNKALDEAMERAINKASPLPKPGRPEVFVTDLHFVFKPRGD